MIFNFFFRYISDEENIFFDIFININYLKMVEFYVFLIHWYKRIEHCFNDVDEETTSVVR